MSSELLCHVNNAKQISDLQNSQTSLPPSHFLTSAAETSPFWFSSLWAVLRMMVCLHQLGLMIISNACSMLALSLHSLLRSSVELRKIILMITMMRIAIPRLQLVLPQLTFLRSEKCAPSTENIFMPLQSDLLYHNGSSSRGWESFSMYQASKVCAEPAPGSNWF